MAVKENIVETDHLFIGEDRYLNFLITEDGQPLDCSAMTLEWVLARNKLDAPIVTKESPTISTSDGDGTKDKVTVPLVSADTINLLPGWYVHTLRRTDGGSVFVLSFGKVYLGRAAG